ncbi:MAG TPA: chorismate lyase [Gammaproteobacteria bacterium]|nr:chorismate lyase [Gammaproteobacteria bacterium]
MQQTDATADRWRRVSAWPETERPPAPWSWLLHTGSLTQKLRDFTGDAFHVQVLRETADRLAADDAQLLGLLPAAEVQLREVYLCGLQPLVFGRTLAPSHGAARWLDRLGAQPLGERVFAENDTARGEIEVRQLAETDALYRHAVSGLMAPCASLWARRSVLRVQETQLLIYECFLPGVSD